MTATEIDDNRDQAECPPTGATMTAPSSTQPAPGTIGVYDHDRYQALRLDREAFAVLCADAVLKGDAAAAGYWAASYAGPKEEMAAMFTREA